MKNKRNKWNTEKVKELYLQYGLTVLEDYKNNNTPIKCLNQDGYYVQIALDNVLTQKNGNTFPFNVHNPYTIKNIKMLLENSNTNTELISNEYNGNNSKMLFKCGKCGNIFERSLSNIKDHHRYYCRKCSRKDITVSQRLDYDKVVELYKNNNLTIMDGQEYVNNTTPIKCINSDNYMVKISYNNLLKGKTPIIFSNILNKENYIYNINNFINMNNIDCEFVDVIDNEYLLLKCNCGENFKVTRNAFVYRGRYLCEKCCNLESALEHKTCKWLNENNINYIRQHRFEDCKYKKSLPFDFYLPDHNICIEVDGQQHYKVDSKYYNKLVEIRDNIKTKYCEDKNIKLIRIPYWEFNNSNYKNILSKNIL